MAINKLSPVNLVGINPLPTSAKLGLAKIISIKKQTATIAVNDQAKGRRRPSAIARLFLALIRVYQVVLAFLFIAVVFLSHCLPVGFILMNFFHENKHLADLP